MKRTLLTGFGPFGNVIDNPSQRLVEHFAKLGAPGHLMTTHVFPVSYVAVEEGLKTLLDKSGDKPFDIVLMLGVNAGAHEWRVERIATNADTAGSKDSDGLIADGSPIVSGAPEHFESSLPIAQLVEVLNKAGLPAVISDFAGGYLCNHLMYRALNRLTAAPLTISGFIHIPADPITLDAASQLVIAYPPFSKHIVAIETILNELA